MYAAAEASGVLHAVAGVHAFDVAADDGGVEACVVAGDDDDEEDACGVEGFNDIPAVAVDFDACGVERYNEIPAGADDIDTVGDAGLGSCCEAKYS